MQLAILANEWILIMSPHKKMIDKILTRWETYLSLILLIWTLFGQPIKDAATWAFEIGRKYEKLRSDFDFHCKWDSTAHLEIIQRCEAKEKFK